jgi:hypothetical protein
VKGPASCRVFLRSTWYARAHLDSLPGLYRPHETYLPVRWDFSGFKDVVQTALANPENLRRIALTAFQACRDYLDQGRFFDDCAAHLTIADAPAVTDAA